MADFVSQFWNWWISIPTVLGLIACGWLVYANTTTPKSADEVDTMHHVWDEDLQEYDHALPKWWLNMFYITIVFGLIYLLLYPGLGSWAGLLKQTNLTRYEAEMQAAQEEYGPLYAKYAAVDLEQLKADPEAMKTGKQLFSTYCTSCHGSDARGARGFPNLRDSDWLWGGAPEQVKTSILNGRLATMPPKGGLPLTDDEVSQVTDYVMSLSGREVDAAAVEAGKGVFNKICMACHLPTGEGNQALGAPNLTDDVWLYGASRNAILTSIGEGRKGVMPAHGEFLGEEKVHLVSAYVLSLAE